MLLSARRASPSAGALVVLAVALLSCARSESTACAYGLICPEGTVCSSDGASCIAPDSQCGDGVVQADSGERCDDGNRLGSDGCSSDCKSDERCGNGQLDLNLGEICDDANNANGDGCSANCRSQGICGNGIEDPGEACDDGNANDEDDCAQCAVARCGDGFVNTQGTNKESCDYKLDGVNCDFDCTPRVCGDGLVNGAAGEQCDPPGASADFLCTSQCTVVSTGRCGNQIAEAGEACDDGNTNTETSCPYGTPSCIRCSADCRASLELTGPYCGDGTVNGAEVCDDNNSEACGTCSANCSVSQLTPATGSIKAVPAAQFLDGETFSLLDGLTTEVIFEFDNDGRVLGANLRVDISAAVLASEVASAMERAITAQKTAAISAIVSGETVLLTHDSPGAFGNQAITERVVDGGFLVNGMSGGTGRDCPADTGCKGDNDCVPNLRGCNAVSGVCQ